MNRSLYLLLSVLSVVGCSESTPSDDGERQDPGHTLFSAGIETLLFEDDTADPFERVWSQGDYIGVFASEQGCNERYILKRSGYGCTEAEFYGPLVVGERIMAYYPYDATIEGKVGAIPLTLATSQIFHDDRSILDQFLAYCPRTYAVFDGDSRLTFGYPLGLLILQIHLETPVTVTELVLTSAAHRLAGTGSVDEDLVLSMSSSASPSVTLDCGDGLPSHIFQTDDSGVDVLTWTNYCLILPPAEYAGRDLSLEIRTVEEGVITCSLQRLSVRRIVADACAITTTVITAASDGGFDTETGYLEGSVIFAPGLPDFDTSPGYFEPLVKGSAVGDGRCGTLQGVLDVES